MMGNMDLTEKEIKIIKHHLQLPKLLYSGLASVCLMACVYWWSIKFIYQPTLEGILSDLIAQNSEFEKLILDAIKLNGNYYGSAALGFFFMSVGLIIGAIVLHSRSNRILRKLLPTEPSEANAESGQ